MELISIDEKRRSNVLMNSVIEFIGSIDAKIWVIVILVAIVLFKVKFIWYLRSIVYSKNHKK